MKYKVKATNKYQLKNISDSELSQLKNERYIPNEGEIWEVDEERKNLLLENGFVTLVDEEEKTKRKKKKSE